MPHNTAPRDTVPRQGMTEMGDVGPRSYVEMIMGLPFSIQIRGAHRPDAERAAVQRAWADLRQADTVFSTFRPDSEISRLARDEIALDDCRAEVREVLALAEDARQRTSGAFDIRYAAALDPAGIVKGWAAQRAAQHLDGIGSGWYLCAGGDILLQSPDPGMTWRVGIEDPFRPSQLLTALTVPGGAVATSGSAHRGRHVLTPSTGLPPTAIAQATVYGPSLLWADIYATALVASDTATPRWSMTPGYDCLLVGSDGKTWCSGGIRGLLMSQSEGPPGDGRHGLDEICPLSSHGLPATERDAAR